MKNLNPSKRGNFKLQLLKELIDLIPMTIPISNLTGKIYYPGPMCFDKGEIIAKKKLILKYEVFREGTTFSIIKDEVESSIFLDDYENKLIIKKSWSNKNFRILKKLLPKLRTLYTSKTELSKAQYTIIDKTTTKIKKPKKVFVSDHGSKRPQRVRIYTFEELLS